MKNKVLAKINNIVSLDGKMYRIVYVGYPGSVEHMNIAGYGADPIECVVNMNHCVDFLRITI